MLLIKQFLLIIYDLLFLLLIKFFKSHIQMDINVNLYYNCYINQINNLILIKRIKTIYNIFILYYIMILFNYLLKFWFNNFNLNIILILIITIISYNKLIQNWNNNSLLNIIKLLIGNKVLIIGNLLIIVLKFHKHY